MDICGGRPANDDAVKSDCGLNPVDAREKPTTVFPVAYNVTQEEPGDTTLEVVGRTAFLGAISAGIAMLVKRVLYPKLLEMQPDDLPVALPVESGFFAAGSGITALALLAKSKKVTTRRSFFYTFAAGIGAVAGSSVARKFDENDHTIEDSSSIIIKNNGNF